MIKDQIYYVLSLSHKHIRFYKGDKYGLDWVEIRNLPQDMKRTLNIDEYPNWRETHNIAPAGLKGSEGFHGQYNVHETDKKMLVEFFRRIDKQLHYFLLDKHDPLILTGVSYLLPIYRKVNTYPFLLDKAVTGNMEIATLDEIHKRVMELRPFARIHAGV